MPDDVIVVEELRKVYPSRRGPESVAVDGVSFRVGDGESVAVVGESGSGKTTTAKIVVGLEAATSGAVSVAGEEMTSHHKLKGADRRRRGRVIQMVFQDPYLSLDPRQRIDDGLEELSALHFDEPAQARRERVDRLLDQVGLDTRQRQALPSALSGGQRQRVAIARALAPEPRVLVLDEAVAALDVSIQAQILNLLVDIRRSTGVAYLFISHDLSVVRQVTDRTIVMKDGSIVEQGSTEQVLNAPAQAYTRRLVESIPRPGWKPVRTGRRAEASA